MAFEIPKQPYSGNIEEITIGTGNSGVKIGGEDAYPFHCFEGNMPNPPKVAMEIWDYDPSDEWPEASVEPFKDVISSPDSWAKKCIDEFGADMIVLQLKSTDPNGKDRGAEEAAKVAKTVLDAIDVPLVVWGTANNQKDEEVLKKISEECQGKNLALAPVEEGNHRGVGASALGYGHVIISSSPIDVNLAKQLNILLGNLGVQSDKIIIDPTTGGLGYGLEYSYSVMERIRMAALTQEDDKLQVPMITNIGNEIWKCKEVAQNIEEAPTLGDPERRGIFMEATAAVSYLLSGADVVILRHPESVRLTRSFIELMINGKMATDVECISKRLELKEVDLVSLSPEPNLAISADAAPPKEKASKPKVATAASKPEKKEEKPKEAAAKPEKKVVELKPKAEDEVKKKADKEDKEHAEAAAKAEAEAKSKEKEELQELRYKRALERERHEAERGAIEGTKRLKTPAAEQSGLVDRLCRNLDRIHKNV